MENLIIDPQKEFLKISQFIKKIIKKTKMKKIIIGLSGGIDSTTSLFILWRTVPADDILTLQMPYQPNQENEIIEDLLDRIKIPAKNRHLYTIKPISDFFKKQLNLKTNQEIDQLRLGNIMARIRMIILFDLAKKNQALVCGTENKSEFLLGYFTRYGDQASDLEIIRHLYKTQIYQLAHFLKVPQSIIKKEPSAGLWPNQTDEKELGFNYQEADQVMYLYFEKKQSLRKILQKGFKNAEKIISRCRKNQFKHLVPYHF
ncbi:MAG: NAD+ synthase [Microgenomates group bacterium]|nr:NAD+ synthase [Microgenomates group bacterium]